MESKQRAILDLMAQFQDYCLTELVKIEKSKTDNSIFSAPI